MPKLVTAGGLSARILDAWRGGNRVPSGQTPATAAEAYAVQRAVMAELGAVAGFKTAHRPGEERIFAPIPASGVVPSGATVASRFGGQLGVELEVGLRLTAPLPDPADPDFARKAAAAVIPVAVIELVDTRLEGPGHDAPLAKLADNQINAGLVVGPVMTGWAGGTLSRVHATLRAGEQTLLDAEAALPGGDAMDTLAGLAAVIGDHCGGLQPGQIVITGTLNPLTYLPPGTLVEGMIDGFGAISVRIV